MPEAQSPIRTLAAPERTFHSRGRRGQALKFLGSMRGQGALLSAAGETAVTYQLDVYQNGAERTGSGTLDGDMAALSEADDPAARLRLSNGRELSIALQGIDERGAEFEARGALPSPA